MGLPKDFPTQEEINNAFIENKGEFMIYPAQTKYQETLILFIVNVKKKYYWGYDFKNDKMYNFSGAYPKDLIKFSMRAYMQVEANKHVSLIEVMNKAQNKEKLVWEKIIKQLNKKETSKTE